MGAKTKILIGILLVFFVGQVFPGCTGGGSSTTSSSSSSPSPTVREYTGTASVGDFITISINATAKTISYTNVTNGESGTVSYTIDADGGYIIDDPDGNLITAFEVPGFALVLDMYNTGAGADTPALVTAFITADISKDDLKDNDYNFLQFRTNGGGMELGYVDIEADGSMDSQNYWPFGDFDSDPLTDAFFPVETDWDVDDWVDDPDGKFVSIYDPIEDETSYMFATESGLLAIDTANGSIIAFEKQPTKDFNPDWAGTYKTILYDKTVDFGDDENLIIPTIDKGDIVIDATGKLTVPDGSEFNLVPLEDYDGDLDLSPDFYDPIPVNGKLIDPCHGIFVVRNVDVDPSGTQTENVFVVFINGAMLFASFGTFDDFPEDGTEDTYMYTQGVGLKIE
ncbi:hypothetical protein HY605_00590 [Candidatus Peregrinibacteria bacterium]|nr:hypothetical protein [Candidatus Peregrinibacteria bacterium]